MVIWIFLVSFNIAESGGSVDTLGKLGNSSVLMMCPFDNLYRRLSVSGALPKYNLKASEKYFRNVLAEKSNTWLNTSENRFVHVTVKCF